MFALLFSLPPTVVATRIRRHIVGSSAPSQLRYLRALHFYREKFFPSSTRVECSLAIHEYIYIYCVQPDKRNQDTERYSNNDDRHQLCIYFVRLLWSFRALLGVEQNNERET